MADPRREHRARLAEAAAWRVRLTDAGLETSPELEAWIAARPENAAAWREAQDLWRLLGDHAGSPELLSARRTAVDRAHRASAARSGRVGRLAILAAGLACGFVLSLCGWRAQPKSYRTARAERQVVSLSDGSIVTLDADTVLKVRYRPRLRSLTLVRGQARFDVAHDLARPFQVRAGEETVIASGTSFDVAVREKAVRVVLIAGKVSVLGGWSGPPTGLSPGQGLVAASARGRPHVAAVNLDHATAWEAGDLVFDDEPLSAAAAEVSRHAARSVKISDPTAADLRISGVFKAGDLATFVDTVTRYFPLRAETSGLEQDVVLRSR